MRLYVGIYYIYNLKNLKLIATREKNGKEPFDF
jgi:hypothetical protein